MAKKISNNTLLEILGLYLGDYRKKMHVREISRALKKNHRTISLNLQKLEKKGILKHEIVGKNKQYFLNMDNFTTKECLKNAESLRMINLIESNFLIKKLATEIMPFMKDTAIILFGSYAKGSETKDSDIDILIIKDGNEPVIVNKLKELGQAYNKEINAQKATQEQIELGLKEKDNLIIEVLHNHIVLNNANAVVDMIWRYYNGR